MSKSPNLGVKQHVSPSAPRAPPPAAMKKSLCSSQPYLPIRRRRRILHPSDIRQPQSRRSSDNHVQRATKKTYNQDAIDAQLQPENEPVTGGSVSELPTPDGDIATDSIALEVGGRARTPSGSRVRGVVDEVLTQRERERQAVKRENERIMKRREMRRAQEMEAKEVRRAEIYAINAFMRDVYLHHYAAFDEAKRLEEERGEARLQNEEGGSEGSGESGDEEEGGDVGMDRIGGV